MSYKSELQSKYYPSDYSLTPKLRDATLKLELTNICNHRCITCPHSKQMRKKGFMNPDLARRLIKEAADNHVQKIALFLNGEPFLVPEISEYVRYAKMLGLEYAFLTTNGSVASESQLAAVMDAGLDSLKFSINACDSETYRMVHGQNDFNRVLENLQFAKKYRDKNNIKCRLLIGCVLTDYTKGMIEEYNELFHTFADEILFLKPDNFGGYMVEEVKQIFHDEGLNDPRVYSFDDKRIPCPLLFNSVNVTYEGYLTLCCSEACNYMVTEDLNQMGLLEAWNSPRMQMIRKQHIDGNIDGMQCSRCITGTLSPVNPLREDLFNLSTVQKREE